MNEELRLDILNDVSESVPRYNELYDDYKLWDLIRDILEPVIVNEEFCPNSEDFGKTIISRVYVGRNKLIYVTLNSSVYDEDTSEWYPYYEDVEMFNDIVDYVEEVLDDEYVDLIDNVLEKLGVYSEIEKLVDTENPDYELIEQIINERYLNKIIKELKNEIEKYVTKIVYEKISSEDYDGIFCNKEGILEKFRREYEKELS